MPPSPPLVRVAVLNDYPIVVAGLVHMMQRHPDRVRVVPVDPQDPDLSDVDILLCDTFATSPDAGPTAADLVTRGGARIVLFTGDLAAASIDAAMRAGIAGYISKRIPVEDLVDTLEAIHRGGAATAPDPEEQDGGRDADRDADSPGVNTWPGREVGLTSREAEVIAYIALGLSNDEIARALFLSINSVKTYIRTAYRKIGISRRTQAVVWAVQHGFHAESARRLLEPSPAVTVTDPEH